MDLLSAKKGRGMQIFNTLKTIKITIFKKTPFFNVIKKVLKIIKNYILQ